MSLVARRVSLWSFGLAAALCVAPGCEQRRAPERTLPVRALPSQAPAREKAPDRPRAEPGAREAATPATPSASAAPVPPATASAEPASAVVVEGEALLIVDDLVDVGPAGPATAHERGVVLVTKTDAVLVAKRGAFASGPSPGRTAIAPLDREKKELAPYGRGPAVAGAFAYWVSQGRLVRRRIDGSGTLEVLATDARSSTRVVAAAQKGARPFAIYVARPETPEDPPLARLLVEGEKPRTITPDGAGASSVALAAQGSGWMLLAIDGRSGMTPLHARRIRFQNGRLVLGADQVAWVGAGSQSTTEVFAAAVGEDVWAFLPIERDVVHFGLAQIHIGREPRVDVPATFLPFPNGANTSPVATASICGKTVVAFARPAGKEPGSPQELVLGELGANGVERGTVIVRSKAFADASLAGFSGGGLLAYTADHRTWAAALRCR